MHNIRDTHLDCIDHLPRLVRPALASDEVDVFLQQGKFVVGLPVGLLQLDSCGSNKAVIFSTRALNRS